MNEYLSLKSYAQDIVAGNNQCLSPYRTNTERFDACGQEMQIHSVLGF